MPKTRMMRPIVHEFVAIATPATCVECRLPHTAGQTGVRDKFKSPEPGLLA